MNRWKIPKWLESEVIDLATNCVYCGIEFRADTTEGQCSRSWVQIVNDARIVTRENIALCCIGCNPSKGAKDLFIWLSSKYRK
jgi:hypothetical protein